MSAKILVDASRNPRASELLPQDLSAFGFVVDLLKDPKEFWRPVKINSEALKGYDALVIPSFPASFVKGSPTGEELIRANYQQEEIESMLSFVEQGGGLLVMKSTYPFGSSDGSEANLDEITENFGVKFLDRIERPVVRFEEHPITQGVERLTISFCHLLLTGTAVGVAYTDQDRAAIAVTSYGKGRVVVMGTLWGQSLLGGASYHFSTYEADNLQLLLNALSWLTRMEAVDAKAYVTGKLLEKVPPILEELRARRDQGLDFAEFRSFQLFPDELRLVSEVNQRLLDAEDLLGDSREAYLSEEHSKAQFLAEEALNLLREAEVTLVRLLQTLKLEQPSGDLEINLNIQTGILDAKVKSPAFPPELAVSKTVYTPLFPYYNLRIDVLEALGVPYITASRPAIIYLVVEGGCVGGFELHRLSPKGWNLFVAHNDREGGLECQNWYAANYRLNQGQVLPALEIEITYVPFYLAPTYLVIFLGLLMALALFLIIWRWSKKQRMLLSQKGIISVGVIA